MLPIITTSTASPRLTALQQLKANLGDEEHLLRYIPVHEVKMATKIQKDAWMPQRLQVALLAEGKVGSKVWAYVSETVSPDGSFDLMYCIGEDCDQSSRCTLQHIVDKDAFVGIFKTAGLGRKTPVLIKVSVLQRLHRDSFFLTECRLVSC